LRGSVETPSWDQEMITTVDSKWDHLIKLSWLIRASSCLANLNKHI
jgi:hypothetical protein